MSQLYEGLASELSPISELTVLDSGQTLISVHEHVGEETLEYPNGVDVSYRQSVSELERRLCDLPWRRFVINPSAVAAVCLPMPYYLRFKRSLVDDVTAVCEQRNHEVLTACAAWRSGPGSERDVAFLPLPALLATSLEPAAEFDRRYATILDRVIALKWHPAAESRTPTDFIRAGYLDLAAERRLPLIVHCARVGTPGDLGDLLADLVPAAVVRGVRVDIAHVGFLHPRLTELAGLPGVFTDCCPWEAICSSSEPVLDGVGGIELLTEIMSTLSKQMCLGFDTPWHVQLWDDGRRHGRSAIHDLEAVSRAAALAGMELQDLFFRNARRLLFGSDA